MKQTSLSEFMLKLQHNFNDKNIIDEALRHSSFVNEQPDTEKMRDNERFEFLGDAVLNLVIGHILMRRYPDLHEGDLSRIRSNLVNESQLAEVARSMGLGNYLQLGKGELQTNGREKPSILADTLEAVIAAVYLDAGFEKTFQVIEIHFSELLDNSVATPALACNYKSQIQELIQEHHNASLVYTMIQENGPAHAKTFKMQLAIDKLHTVGVGKSKKMAEQDAAKQMFELIKKV